MKNPWYLLGQKWACECGRTHEVPTRAVVVKAGAREDIAGLFSQLGFSRSALLIADERTWEVAGRAVERSLKKAGIASRSFLVRGERPRADAETAALVAEAALPSDAVVVSIGSGTITDLSKWAAFAHGLPQIAVATAPSMNGYASGIVALNEGGLKTTRAVTPPIAVVADIDVLAAAPMDMIRAGLGDVLSKSVCNADWKLASIIRGEQYCPVPGSLIRELESRYLPGADGLARRDPEMIEALTLALILSGVSMVIAGSSAPASGGEHLISHVLDMRADAQGRAHDLHGAQVGVATLATACLYERLMALDRADLKEHALETVWERGEALLPRLRQAFGAAGEVVAGEFLKKRASREEAAIQARLILKRWDAIRESLGGILVPCSQIRTALDLAGATVHYAKLGVDADAFREALLLAMGIRDRYTVLDLAFAVGELEAWADEVVGAV